MENLNLNLNEEKVLTSIIKDCNNYGTLSCWTSEIEVNNLSMNQIKGYISALVKKNIVWSENGEVGVIKEEILDIEIKEY